MNDAYIICTEERGSGSYARMKSAMINHVERTSRTMFRESTDVVGMSLGSMSMEVNDALLELTEEIFQRMSRDYETVLLGVSANTQASMPRAERVLRLEMTKPLSVADAAFRPLVDGGPVKDELPTKPDEEEPSLKVKAENAASEAREVPIAQLSGVSEDLSTAEPLQSESPKVKLENDCEVSVSSVAEESFAVGRGSPSDEFLATGYVKAELV